MSGRPAGAPGAHGRARYAFGDTDQAASRLALVAEVFEPVTRAFLTESSQMLTRHAAPSHHPTDPGIDPDQEVDQEVDLRIGLAVDLGCGPGHTTRLLAETLRPRRVIGLDSSPAFIDLARGAREPRAPGSLVELEFAVHDVTRTPFPSGPADVLFCRLLLSHLSSPGDTIAAWATQLRPGGILLVDEVDWIDPRDPVLRDYLAAVDAVLTHQGHRLYIGPLLDAMPAPAGLERVASRVATLSPPAAKAAAMFAMNLRVWRGHPYARSELGDAELDRLAAGIDDLASAPGDARITWGLRQIVYRLVV